MDHVINSFVTQEENAYVVTLWGQHIEHIEIKLKGFEIMFPLY
jgi:hypothetical protein